MACTSPRPALALCAVAAVVTAAGGAGAAGVDDYGLAVDLGYAFGSAQGEVVSTAVNVAADAVIRLGERLSLSASGRLEYDPAGGLRPRSFADRVFDHATALNRAVDLGSAGSFELRDLYLEWQPAWGALRIGRQQTVWGKLDGLRVLDRVNPADFHQFILLDDAERRLPQWGVHLDTQRGEWRLESVLGVDGTVHDIPDPGSWFEFTAPRFRFGASDTGGLPQDLTVRTTLPDALDDASFGVRLSRYFGQAEVSLMAHAGNDFEAVGRIDVDGGASDGVDLDSGQPVLERRFARREIVGIGIETDLLGAIVRGELALQPD